jgi:hypothetical protein
MGSSHGIRSSALAQNSSWGSYSSDRIPRGKAAISSTLCRLCHKFADSRQPIHLPTLNAIIFEYARCWRCGAPSVLRCPSHSRGVAQPGRAPGSGPGGRRFKSSLPDQFFQILKLRFWFSVCIDGVEIVDGACVAGFSEDFRRELQSDFPVRCPLIFPIETPMQSFLVLPTILG